MVRLVGSKAALAVGSHACILDSQLVAVLGKGDHGTLGDSALLEKVHH